MDLNRRHFFRHPGHELLDAAPALVDISLGGAQLRSLDALPRGSPCQICIDSRDAYLDNVASTVVSSKYQHGSYRVHVQFNLDRLARIHLQRYLFDLELNAIRLARDLRESAE